MCGAHKVQGDLGKIVRVYSAEFLGIYMVECIGHARTGARAYVCMAECIRTSARAYVCMAECIGVCTAECIGRVRGSAVRDARLGWARGSVVRDARL